jgi:hypothetical protein
MAWELIELNENEGEKMKSIFRGCPDAYDIIEHLIERIEYELSIINKEKKSSIKWWSDFRYARYDVTRMVLMQQLRELKVLYKQVERADLSEQAAIDGASTEPPF